MMMHSAGMLMMAVMGILTVAVIAAAVAVVVWLTRTTASPPRVPGADDGAEVVLRRRYAAGEIDDREYRKRLATLRGQPLAVLPD